MIRFIVPLEDLGATERLAGALARGLAPGDVVALSGDLGAGKTTTVRMLVGAAGGDSRAASSPTFVIAQEYDAPTPLVHIDAYRVGDEDELDAIGWDRLTDHDRIVLIEWPEKISRAIEELGGRVTRVLLEATGESSREATVDTRNRSGLARELKRLVNEIGGEVRTDRACPTTAEPVASDSPTWPFASERARDAELGAWFNESYTISRPMEEADLEQGE